MQNVTITRQGYERLLHLEKEVSRLQDAVDFLTNAHRLGQVKRFGSSSEQSQYDQISLFNEAEFTADTSVPEPEMTEVKAYHRKTARTRKESLPEDLPVETIEYVLQGEEAQCPQCACAMETIGKHVRETLKIIPAQALIRREIQYTYVCPCCEKEACKTPVKKAGMPPALLSGSIASAESVAQIMVQKFVMGSPLYRQEQEWGRQGLPLSRQTMSNWLLSCSERYLKAVYDLLHQRLLREEILHADETTLQVLREEGKAAQSKSYMWLYRTGKHTLHPIVLYEYQPDRKGRRPVDYLQGFEGYLHTDGYSGYRVLPKSIVLVGCLAHARRKFDEALKSMPSSSQADSLAWKGKQYCDRLFLLEREWAKLSAEDRYKGRQEKSVPLLSEFYTWLRSLNVSSRSIFGKAVTYCIQQEIYLRRYLLDGRLEISNNLAERSIKPFVTGRKNFLFANTARGATASAVIYSLIETAKANQINPYEYLLFVLKKAPSMDLKNHPEQAQFLLPEAFKNRGS